MSETPYRIVPPDSELAAQPVTHVRGVVTGVKADGAMVEIELVVSDPARLVALIPLAELDELNLRPGMAATAIVTSTSIIVNP